MKMQVMIAEDERLAREELIYLLEQEKDILLLPSAVNGRELLQLVEQHHPDILFLDIQMPEMEGIQAARMLSSRSEVPLIVFTTAHEDYAIDAFGLGAVDYLLKPYDYRRLQVTLDRLRQRWKERNREPGLVNRSEQDTTVTLVQEKKFASPASNRAKLIIDHDHRLIVIDPDTILYAIRQERLIEIHTTSQTYTSKMTLQQLEEKLAAHSFFRTHRSYLVNMEYVLELIPWFNGAYNLTLKDAKKTQIPVSRSSVKDLIQLLQGE
jgi:two-component system response regulator LytT